MSRSSKLRLIYTVKGNKKPGYQNYPDKEKGGGLDVSCPNPLMQPSLAEVINTVAIAMKIK